MTPVTPPARRLATAAGLLTLVLLSCGKELTAPGSTPVNAFHRSGSFAFSAEYETAVKGPELRAALSQVPFERVRVTLRREDGSIALDTVVLFPAGADSLTLSLTVPLSATAPSTGVPLNLNLNYVNAAGDTVFKGTTPVTVLPSSGTGTPPPPVQVPVQYTGTGANATAVVITPKTAAGLGGQSTTFTAQARGSAGQVITGTPIVFSSSNTAVATVPNPSIGTISFVGRGTARIYATLLTGPKDSATVTVTMPATRLQYISGDGNEAFAGEVVPVPVVVRALAADNLGVSGVKVHFAPTDNGSVSATDVDTDADGYAKVTWTLGTAPGVQKVVITSPGLTGSPINVAATARAAVPTALALVNQPETAQAGKPMPAVQVRVVDGQGTLATGYNAAITAKLNNNPTGARLSGTTAVQAVNGIATFSNLSIDKPGSGYALNFSSGNLTDVTSLAFSVTAGAATQLVFTAAPTSGDAVTTLGSVAVTARDDAGNTATSFSGTVSLSATPAAAASLLTGTLQRAAVAGVATFNDLKVTAPTSLSLVASAPGLASTTSAPITITTGAPATLTLERGGSQTKVAGSVLDTIVVRLTDAGNNPVSGKSVAFAVTAGGGSVSPSTATTDANGRAWTLWTIGSGSQTMTATVTGVTPVTVAATGTAGAPTQLKFVAAPPATLAAEQVSAPITAEVLDARGSRVASYNSPFVLSIASGPANASLSGKTSVTPVNGLATFSEIYLLTAGTYTLKLTSGTLPAITSSAVVVTNAKAAKIAADSGADQTNTVSKTLNSPFVVLVTDRFGNPASGVNVTWAVASGGGSLGGGAASGALSSTTTVTDANGRTRATLTLGSTAGANTVTATASGLSGSPVTFSAVGLPSTPSQLAVTTQPPTTGSAGTALSSGIVVTAQDAAGNVATSFNSGIKATIASGPAGATIIGVDTLAASSGVATFGSLAFDKAGAYTLTFASSGLTSATTNSFTISAGAAKNILADSGMSQSGTVGTTLASAFVVRVTDQYGNPVSGTSVTWAVANGSGSLSATTTTTDANGRARTKLTLGATTGTNAVTATSSGLTGSPVTFSAAGNAAVATQLVITTAPAATQTSGTTGGTIVVEARDASNNLATSFTGSVALSIASGPAAATFMGPASVTAAAGVASFGGVAFDKAGTYTISFSASGLSTATSGSFVVGAGAAKFIAADSGNTQSGTAGAALTSPFVVRVTDQYGNGVSGTSVTWAVATGGGSLSGTTTTTDANGRARVTLTLGATAGTNSVTAASTGLTGSPVTFNATGTAATASALVLTSPPQAVQIAGTAGTNIVVQARDANNNLATAFNGIVAMSIASGPAGATIIGTTSATAVGGIATFSNIAFGKAGTYTLAFAYSGLTSATSASFVVNPGAATTIVADSGAAQSGVAGAALSFPFVVRTTDAYGNPVSATSVTWSVSTGGGSLSGTTTMTDPNGRVRTTLTLGATAGTNTVTATSTGLTGSPITFTATGSAGAASQLALTTSAAGAAVGAAFTTQPVVAVRDAQGNTVTTDNSTVVTMTVSSGGTVVGTATATAVSGVATFTNVGISGLIAPYTLTFASGSLTSATQSITPTAGAVATVTVTPASVSLLIGQTQQFTAALQDVAGNTTAGTVVWSSSNAASATVSASGLATAVTLGSPTIKATSTANTGVFGTASLSVIAGTATKLAITQQPPTSATAGAALSPALTVVARDVSNNLATSFVGTVSVAFGANPSAGTLSGTATATAVAGVATFSNLSIDKVGTGYTLTFTSTGLTSVTSSSVNVVAAAAAQIAADSGASQSGLAGQPVSTRPVAKVTDAYGNPVSGVSVTWGTPSSGGSLANATTATDPFGRVRADWTLGLVAGAQSVTATSAGLTGSPVTFGASASSVSYNKLWKGTTDTLWTTASNWSPAGVPVATDSVYIGAASNQPSLTAAATTARFTMAASTSLHLQGFNLTLTGEVATGTSSVVNASTGKVILNSAAAMAHIVGPSFPDVQVSSVYFLGGATNFNGNVTVDGSGQLSTQGYIATITGSLTTANSATIAISGSGGVMDVAGNVTFGGGATQLVAGELRIGGNFAQTAGTVSQSAGQTRFVGSGAHTISFADQTSTSYFYDVGNGGTGDITLSTSIRAKGLVKAETGAGKWIGTGKAVRSAGVSVVSTTQFAVDTVDVWFSNTMSLTTGLTTTLVITGNPVSPGANFVLNGDLSVEGSGNFNANSKFVKVANLWTKGSGQLSMSGTDSLDVTGNATFAGGILAGTLTNGALSISGNFSQTTGTQSFKASPAHRTWLTGGANQTVAFANPDNGLAAGCASSCFGQLRVSKTAGAVVFTSNAKADSSMTFTGADSVWAPNFTLHARGDFSATLGSGGRVKAQFVKYAGDIPVRPVSFLVDTLVAFGTSVVLKASEAQPIIIQGTATLPSAMNNIVIVDGTSGVLSTSGQSTVKALVTRSGGTLKMLSASDTLTVTDSAVFGGGATTGLLTAGGLIVNGPLFRATGSAYDATGTHSTIMAGTSTQSISWTTPTAGKGHRNLRIRNTGAKQFVGDQYVTGDVTIESSANTGTPLSGSYYIYVGGNIVDNSGLGTGGWGGSSMITFTGTPTALPTVLKVNTLKFTGGATVSLANNLSANYVIVDGTGTRLKLNGRYLYANGNSLTTQNGGTIEMTTAGDSVEVGSAVFNGGSETSLLTTGGLATGSFTQGGGTATSYAADSTHRTWISTGNTTTTTFANPGFGAAGSHFGTFIHNTSSQVNFASDVYVEGQIRTGSNVQFPVNGTSSGSSRLLAVHGAATNHLYLTNTRLKILDGQPVTQLADLKFLSMPGSDTQLEVVRSGNGSSGSVATLSSPIFSQTLTTGGYYLRAEDSNSGDALALAINMTSPTPATATSSLRLLVNGATTDWPTGLNITAAANGNWGTASTWSPASVPTVNDNVTIGGTYAITLGANASVKSLTLSGGSLDVGSYELSVNGDITATSQTINGSGNVRIQTSGAHSIAVGSVYKLQIDAGADVTLTQNLSVSNMLIIQGSFTPNGKYVYVGGEMQTYGRLRMMNAADSVVVSSALFRGVASDTVLTAGKLAVYLDLIQDTNAQAFAPSGTHVTWLKGNSGGSVKFTHPGYTQSHFNIVRFDNTSGTPLNFASHVYATRAEVVGTVVSRTVKDTLATAKLFAKGVSLNHVEFKGVPVQIDDGSTIDQFFAAKFSSQADPGDQFTISRSSGTISIDSLTFTTHPVSGGKYINLTDTNGGSDLTLTLSNVNPGSNGGNVSTSGGASFSPAWASAVNYSSSGGSWQTPATWSPSGVPSRYDDVTINAAATVSLAAAAYAKNFTTAGGAAVSLGANNLYVLGNYTGGASTGFTRTGDAPRVYLQGSNTTLQGTLPKVEINGTVSAAGTTTFTDSVTISGSGASFDVGANTVTANNYFGTASSGVFKMGSGTSKLILQGITKLNGGSTSGLLTNGLIQLGSDLTVTGNGLAASGSNTVELNGSAAQSITWNSLSTGSIKNLIFTGIGAKSLVTDINVSGDITINNSVTSDITGAGKFIYWSGALFTDSTAATNGRLAGPYLYITGAATQLPRAFGNWLTVGSTGSLTLSDSVRVNGGLQSQGTITLNGKKLQVSSLEIYGSGVVNMTNANDSLIVNGTATWQGGTPNLTAGTTVFNSRFTQATSSNSNTVTFNPSGSHKTIFRRPLTPLVDSTVVFATPATNFFNDVLLRANIELGSDVKVNGTFERGTVTGSVGMNAPGTTTPLLTVAGLVGDVVYPIHFKSVRMLVVNPSGTTTMTVQNLNFSSFPSAYAGTVFELNRSSATTSNPLTLSNINFSGFTTGATYIKNNAASTINLAPSGTCTSVLSPGASCNAP